MRHLDRPFPDSPLTPWLLAVVLLFGVGWVFASRLDREPQSAFVATYQVFLRKSSEADSEVGRADVEPASAPREVDSHPGDPPQPIIQPGPAQQRLLALVRQGALPMDALEAALLEHSATAVGLSEAQLRRALLPWMETATKRTKARQLQPERALAALKADLYTTRALKYEADADNPGHLAEGRLQCQSGSIVLLWAAMRAELQGAQQGRWVFIHTPAHVRPGWLAEGQLHAVEATTRDEALISGVLEQLDLVSGIRVVSAPEALALALLGDDAPSWLDDRLVLWERLPTQTDPRNTPPTNQSAGLVLPGGIAGARTLPGLRPLGQWSPLDWTEQTAGSRPVSRRAITGGLGGPVRSQRSGVQSSVTAVRKDLKVHLAHRSAVEKTVRRSVSDIETCYTARLKVKPALGGRVAVRLSIASAQVSSATLLTNTTGDPVLGACILEKVRTWRFATAIESDVVYAFILQPSPTGDGSAIVVRPSLEEFMR